MTRVFGTVLCAAVMLAASGCDDPPTSPSDETISFTAQLAPASEVPHVANAEAGGSGVAMIDLNLDRDATGTITAATADFQVTLIGFPVGTPLTMAHVHTGASGATGGILINTGLMPNEISLTNGGGGFTRDGVDVAASVAQDIVNNPGQFYFNVHSVLNPGGMARGQLIRQ